MPHTVVLIPGDGTGPEVPRRIPGPLAPIWRGDLGTREFADGVIARLE